MKAKDYPYMILGALIAVTKNTEENAESLVKIGKSSTEDLTKLIESLEERRKKIRTDVKEAIEFERKVQKIRKQLK